MLDGLTSRQISEWKAFDSLSPLDSEQRMELAIGKLATMFFNANRDANASERGKLADFVPDWREQYEALLPLPHAETAVARMRQQMGRVREQQNQ